MSIVSMLYLALVFVAVFGVSMLAGHYLVPSKARQRLKSLSGEVASAPSGAGEWVSRIVEMSGPLARLSIPEEGWNRSSLRTRFMNAGLRGGQAPVLFFAAKTVLAMLLPVLLWLMLLALTQTPDAEILMLGMLLAAAFGFYLPNLVLAALVRRRQREIFEGFPDALDLMTICIEAGLTVDAAISRVAQETEATSPAVSEELQLVTLELRAGGSKEKALRNLALRTGSPEVETLVSMLIQAEQFGTSVADALRVHSEHLRTRRRQLAEERAAKVALKLLMPLIFCIFPALVLIMLGPALLRIYRVLLPTLGA